jgi:hypothetical protein
MNNRLLLFFVLVALLFAAALPASTVFAAGKTATLVEFKHVPSKGWTAIFKITGDWKAADLKGNTLTVGGKTYNLYCNFRDDNHISCTMHHDIGQLIGKPATFNFAGVASNDVVPPKRICNSWTANWEYSEWLDYYEYGTYDGDDYWYNYWHYMAYWGTVAYGNNTPLEPPFYYYDTDSGTYQQDGYDTVWDVEFWQIFDYYNTTCSEAEYGYDEAWYEWTGIAYGESGTECIGDSCDWYYEYEYAYCEEGDHYYGYCDESDCYHFVEEDGCSDGPK